MQDMNNPLPATKDTHISLLAGPHSQGGYIRVDSSYSSPKIVNYQISYTSFSHTAGCSSDVRNWMMYNQSKTGFTVLVSDATSGIGLNWLSAGK